MQHVHGGDITTFREEYPGREVYDFSANINPLGMPEGVRRTLAESADLCQHYPDPHCRRLRAALAEYENLPEEWILPGNGASDLICRIAWGLHPKRALLPAPTFAEYGQALHGAGCGLRRHLLLEENGFQLGEDLLDALRGADIVFLCVPNNPTGLLPDPRLLEQIVERCRAGGSILVVDECFLDFVEDGARYSARRYLERYSNLVILRAFTKIFAMPGLRLGYLLCADRSLREQIARAGAPWSVSVPAQMCGVAAVGETAYLAETARTVPRWREELAAGLHTCGLQVYPGKANYLFFRGPEGLSEALRPRGVLLRDCRNFEGLGPGHYRAAVRPPEEIAVLLRHMREVVR